MRSNFVRGYVVIRHFPRKLGNEAVLDLIQSAFLPETLLSLSKHELYKNGKGCCGDVNGGRNSQFWNDRIPQVLKTSRSVLQQQKKKIV